MGEVIPNPEYGMDEYEPIQVGDRSKRIMVNAGGFAIYDASRYPELLEEIFNFMINNFDYYNEFPLPDENYDAYLYNGPNPRTLAIFKGPPVDDGRAPPTATGGLNAIFIRYREYREGAMNDGGGRTMTEEEIAAREGGGGRAMTGEEIDPTAGEAKAGPGSESSEEEEDDCAICTESLGEGMTFELPECQHSFHVKCIRRMIEATPPHTKCPLCRKPFNISEVLNSLQDVPNIKDRRLKERVDKKCLETLEAVVTEFKRMIRRITRQKLDNNILYFCYPLGRLLPSSERTRVRHFTSGVSPYFIQKLLKGFLDEFVEYRNQAMIRYLLMFCLQRGNISKEIYSAHYEYLNEFLPDWSVDFEFKMKAKDLLRPRRPAVEHFRISGVNGYHETEHPWIIYREIPSELTDDDFKKGIINEIKRLRILKELIDDRGKYEGGGDYLYERYGRRLKSRSDELYKLIYAFSARGFNPRRDWFGDNDFTKACKAFLEEFEDDHRSLLSVLKRKSDYEKQKYFVKLDVGPVEWRAAGDLEAIEREAYVTMQRRLGEFNQPTPSRWARCCTTPTGGATGAAGAVEAVMEGDEVNESREVLGAGAVEAVMEGDRVNVSSEVLGDGVNQSREVLGGGLRHNRYGNILIPGTASLKTTKKINKRKHKQTKHKRTKNRTKNRPKHKRTKTRR